MNAMDLSIIILSYNTSHLTKQCLDSLVDNLKTTSLKAEIVIVDNDSKDESVEMLENYQKSLNNGLISVKLIENKENVGYPKGNNQGIKVSKGKYILLLNSDVMIETVDFPKLIEYLEKNDRIGALSVRVNLQTGNIDPASHRGFPTPWNAFCYFGRLERLFGALPVIGKLFGGYHMYYKGLDTVHEVDAITGAFFLTRNSVLDEVGGFDETFFMYGEDLDLAYRIKQKGFKVLYYPEYTVLHLKSVSGIKGKDPEVRKKTRKHFFEAMKIFYNKHYADKYPSFINRIVFLFIDYKINHI